MKKKKNKKRFSIRLEERFEPTEGIQIIEDSKTGIAYLYVFGEGHGGLTVLRDEDGKPAFAPE